MGYGFAHHRVRQPLSEACTEKLENQTCRDGDTVHAACLEGLRRDVVFDPALQGISLYEMTEGARWPIGSLLSLPSDQPRPGSVVVTLRLPVGGYQSTHFGHQFSEYAVS